MVAKWRLPITRYEHDKFGAGSERLAQLGPLALLVEELDTVLRRSKRRMIWQGKNSQPAGAQALPEHPPRDRDASDCARVAHWPSSARMWPKCWIQRPSASRMIRHVRPKLFCTACQTVTQAAAPSGPIVRAA
jgi:transposase